MELVLSFYIFFIGLILGSFYCALSSRILYYFYGIGRKEFLKNTLSLEFKKGSLFFNRWKTIFTKRSFCKNCKTTLPMQDLIPLYSFIRIGGRCRFCKTHIPIWNFLGECYLGLLGLLHFYSTNHFLLTIIVLLFFGHLYISLITDYRHFSLDPENTIFLYLLSISYILVKNNFIFTALFNQLLAFSLIFILFLLLFFLGNIGEKKGLGLGDVILVCPLALFLGLPWIFFVLQLGALLSILYIYFYKKNLSAPAPLGAYLVIAILFLFPFQIFLE